MDGLTGVGVGPDGVRRLAWTEEDAATRAWFERQAASVGLRVERDPAGNLWACPEAEPPWWGVGSHLDSVRGGGRFDGPLGVACGFEIAAAGELPVAVLSFADEEGARFNTPTFGSKALAGRLDLPAVLERRDDDGVSLARGHAGGRSRPGRDRPGPGVAPDPAGRFHRDPHRSDHRAGPRGRAGRRGQRAGRAHPARGAADRPGRSRRDDAALGAARCPVRGGAADRGGRGSGGRGQFARWRPRSAHGHCIKNHHQTQCTDHDRRGGAPVDRRPGAELCRDRRLARAAGFAGRRARGAHRGGDRGRRRLALRSARVRARACGRR